MTMNNQSNSENSNNSSNNNDGTRILLDGNGCPIVPLHTVDDSNLVRKLLRTVLIYILFSLVGPLLVLVSLVVTKKIRVSDLREIYQSVTAASNTTTNSSSSSSSSSVVARNKVHDYQDPRLLAQLWKLPSAKPYVQHQALEYQRREGYCSLATLRCILHSFPTFPRTPKNLVPEQTSSGQGRPSTPLQFQHTIETILREATNTGNNTTNTNNDTITIQTEIVGMSDNNQNNEHKKEEEENFSYARFLKTLRDNFKDDADDDQQHCRRVAINYLRPVLFGFKPPKWVPCHLILGLLGGHFSPLLGLLDNPQEDNANAKTGDNPLVGVFDVNHAYGGAYLIPAKLLYQAVKAKDISTGKSRAIIVVTLKHTTQQTTENRSA